MIMKKPRIFINIHYMEIGGAERALLGLLNTIDTDKVDVDLFINQHTGEFMPLIPKKINLLPENKRYSTIERPLLQILKEGHIDIVFARLAARIRHKIYRFFNKANSPEDASIFQYVAKYTTPLLPSLRNYGEYDLAISFLTPHNIVMKKVNAKKKIAWIHTDYSVVSTNTKMELPIWSSFDNIISISQDVTSTFLQAFPSLADKIVEIENILSPKFVREQAKLFHAEEYNGNFVKISSIGRFSYSKNFENIPFVAKILKDKGVKFKWFIVGYGDTSKCIANIKENDVRDCVILLGKTDNPYPYIENCNIYVQPSRYEGKSVTVREAQILGKPVIVTNYPTASSQINDGVDGLICKLDNQTIADTIYELIKNKALYNNIANYLNNNDYGNESEINKLYSIIN